jgi:peptidoglycan/LPS O-acetylase OafA/YrhL
MSDESTPKPADEPVASPRQRMTTALGWVAGGSAGMLLNYALFLAFSDESGQGYPVVPTTFALFVAGAFGGMAIADRGGERVFRPLGIAAGVLLALFVALVAAVYMSPPPVP